MPKVVMSGGRIVNRGGAMGVATVFDGSYLDAIYPLQVIMPRESGTSPEVGEPGFPTGHPILWAHPNEVYNRLAYIRGGMPPYTCWITNAPGNMTTDNFGTITWTVGNDSNGTTYTPTFHVSDAHGSTASQAWTITVDSTRFVWLAETGANGGVGNDSTGAGTKASPYRTLPRLHSTWPASLSNKIAILRGPATYSFTGMWTTNLSSRTVISANSSTDFVLSGTDVIDTGDVIQFLDGPNAGECGFVENNTGGVEGGNYRVNSFHIANPFNSTPVAGNTVGWNPTTNGKIEWRPDLGSCIQWIGYEGEVATVDFGFAGITTNRGVLIRPWSDGNTPAYFDNLRCVNAWIGAFEHLNGSGDGRYTQYRRLAPDGSCPGYACDGANPAFIMQNATSTSWYFQADSIVPILSGGPNGGAMGAGILKTYNQHKPQYSRIDERGQANAWDLKASQMGYECKFNRFKCTSVGQGGIFGNMSGGPTSGVHYHCIVDMRDAPDLTALAADIGQNADVGETWLLNCTLIGRTQVRSVTAGDGPIHFKRCVKIVDSADTGYPDYVYRTGSTDALIDYEDDLNGVVADGYVDTDGKLTGSARTTYLGIRGHEINGVFS